MWVLPGATVTGFGQPACYNVGYVIIVHEIELVANSWYHYYDHCYYCYYIIIITMCLVVNSISAVSSFC